MRHGQHAARHRRRGAATGAARAERVIPRVARGAEEPRLGGRRQPHLRGIGLGEDDQSRALQSHRVLAVVIGHRGGEEPAPVAGHRPGVLRPQILEGKGHAGEGPRGKARGDRRARMIVEGVTTAFSAGLRASTRSMAAFERFLRLQLPPRTSPARPSPSYFS